MKRLIAAVLVAWGLLAGSVLSSEAAVVSYGNGSSTLDTVTGRLWLDLSFTTNRSYLDVANEFGVGGDYEGYQYATYDEVIEFWTNAGIVGTGTTVSGSACCPPGGYMEVVEIAPVAQLVALLGGPTFDPSSGFTGVLALSSAEYDCGHVSTYSCYWTPELRIYGTFAEALIAEGLRDYLQYPIYASWLVSSDAVAPVPLPAALPLLLSALGFFGFFGWRRKRMAA